VLTEQGEILFRTANEVLIKLETVRAQLSESTERPSRANCG
jgi:DNA-binding transcriptional LysR family regulator